MTIYIICPNREKNILQEFIAVLTEASIIVRYAESIGKTMSYRIDNINKSDVVICCGEWKSDGTCTQEYLHAASLNNTPIIVGEKSTSIVSFLNRLQYAH